MKRFQKSLAVLGIVLGVTAAFAFKTSPMFSGTYGIQGETPNSYIVYLTELSTLTEGDDYFCDPDEPQQTHCSLTTALNPSAINATQGKIAKSSSPTLNIANRDFTLLP